MAKRLRRYSAGLTRPAAIVALGVFVVAWRLCAAVLPITAPGLYALTPPPGAPPPARRQRLRRR